MKKILIVSDHFDTGGVASSSVKLAKGLVAKGYDVSLLSSFKSSNKSFDCENVKLISLDSSAFQRKIILFHVIKLGNLLKRLDVDYIISNKDHVNFYVILAKVIFGVRSKLLCNSHNTVSEIYKRPTWKLYRIILLSNKILYRFSDVVVNVSQEACRDSELFFKLKDVSYLPNPVFDHLPDQSFTNPFCDHQAVNILACGRLEYQKNYPFMLSTFKRFLLSEPNARLTILGDGKLRAELESMTRELNIERSVIFLGNVENVGDYMAFADCLWLTSHYEGFGIVLVEALSNGCPVVSTNCKSGPSEIITADCGVLIDGFDEQKHVNGLLTVLNKEQYDKNKLRERASEFTTENSVNRLIDVFL